MINITKIGKSYAIWSDKIRLILRGGEIIEGTIDWFNPYEIKVEFPLTIESR